jgi:hypothetical protein
MLPMMQVCNMYMGVEEIAQIRLVVSKNYMRPAHETHNDTSHLPEGTDIQWNPSAGSGRTDLQLWNQSLTKLIATYIPRNGAGMEIPGDLANAGASS